jgi:hypothetical protein
LNNIFGISKRSKGHIEDDGKVIIDKIESYDVVGNPGFSNAIIDFSDTIALQKQIIKELERQELLEKRKEKIKKLNNL